MANLDIIRGRATVLSLTNQTGSTSSPGDIVRIDTANSDSYVASSASNSTFPIGVVDEQVGIGSNGRVVVSGYARKVKTLAATAKGDFLYTSTTSLTAASMAGSNPSPGAFGYVTTSGSGTATAAHIFEAIPTPAAATVSAGSNSMSVGATNTIGDTSLNLWAPASHRHLGLHSITSSSSNTMDRPTVNFRPGANVGITASDSDGNGVFDTLTISASGGSGSGSSFLGQPVALVFPGFHSIATTTNNGASQAIADPIIIPGTMKVRALYGAFQATSSGSMQWGLFDYSSNPASATKLCGGTGVIGSTGWQAIAATGAPVTVSPGAYMLVTFNPSANSSTWHAYTATVAPPFHQLFSSYTWTDTPDFTSASWAANTTFRIWYLEGDLDSSNNEWK